jgi:hypothetical protein
VYLNAYRDYLNWVDQHFSVGSYFHYEKDLPQIEKYILNLPIFDNTPRLDWKVTFGIDFDTWNRCHYLLSDLSGISQQLEHNSPQSLEYDAVRSAANTQLKPVQQQQLVSSLNAADQQYLLAHGAQYKTVYQSMDQLVKDKILVTPVPIKLQTMTEKRLIIKNFSECVNWYNEWVLQNNIGETYTHEHLSVSMQKELLSWHADTRLTVQPDQLAIEQ